MKIPPLPHSRSGFYVGCSCTDCLAAQRRAHERLREEESMAERKKLPPRTQPRRKPLSQDKGPGGKSGGGKHASGMVRVGPKGRPVPKAK